jgi:hypothetical protein
MKTKKCSKCQREKPLNCFNKNRHNKTSRHRPDCKECRKVSRKKEYMKANQHRKHRIFSVIENGLKNCTMCGEKKPLEDFLKNKKGKNGLRGDCKDCSKRISNENYIKKLIHKRTGTPRKDITNGLIVAMQLMLKAKRKGLIPQKW